MDDCKIVQSNRLKQFNSLLKTLSTALACVEIAKSMFSHVTPLTDAENFTSPEPNYRGKMKKIFFC